MPITASAKKALRQSLRRQTRNLTKRETFKNILKEIKKLIEAKKAKEAETLIPRAYKALDKAAKTGVIKKTAASRKKSRLMKMVKKLRNLETGK